MSKPRLAFYGRLSTDDKQDQTLARPSQLDACRRKAAELGGEITVEFFDQESGARDDRPGWTALTQEARDRPRRRFDAVVIYQTSRLSRDRVSAGLFHRELRKLGVEIHYALGAGDPSTAEGGLLIALQQAFDEYERAKLARETKRGMRQAALQGFRCGGRPPHGYRLERSPHPVAARAKAGDTKTRLVPDPGEAEVVAEIFQLWAERGLGCKAIADRLNRPGGPPSPNHVDRTRNRRRDWPSRPSARCSETPPTPAGWSGTGSTSQANAKPAARRACAPRRSGSSPRSSTCRSSQTSCSPKPRTASAGRPRSNGRRGAKAYLFTGMVRCASGHQPLAMYGRSRKQHTYMTCDYGRSYGREAADQIDGHGQWLSLREDALLPLVERFFCERIFGPMRLDKLARQLRAHQRTAAKANNHTLKRLRDEVAELDRRIGLQIEALEQGIEPQLVRQRIEQLRRDKEAAEHELRAITPTPVDSPPENAAALLARLPNPAKHSSRPHPSSSDRPSRPSASRSSTTNQAAASRSPPPSAKPSPKHSRTHKTSRRRSQTSLKGT